MSVSLFRIGLNKITYNSRCPFNKSLRFPATDIEGENQEWDPYSIFLLSDDHPGVFPT